jgi:ABC-type nitrate/sulfonate/bicarbonate transport system ATPase subunit
MFEYTRTDKVLLEISGVSLSFGDHLILRDVNAVVTDIERPDVTIGQVICFLGPSGIGKTQLSRIIAGLQIPSQGSVTLISGQTKPGMVSMVPQHYPLFDYLTVAQNLLVAGKQGGLSSREANVKASEYIQVFNLEDHLKKYPRELSGGTKQRVAIVRQLMCASHYMVMDEPFSGLDPIMKKKTTEAIIKLSNLHTFNTIIIVTHDVTEGLMCSDTCWMMGLEKGQPGAKLVESYDLAALGFAWRPDLDHDVDFMGFIREVKDRFQTLR